MNKSKLRTDKFKQWWRKNRKHSKAHTWLCVQSRRIAFAYNLHSQTCDEIMFITKRFNQSEYKKLTQDEAHTLWRLVNPLPHERLDMIRLEAKKLQEILDEVKKERRALKYERSNITVKKKRSFTLPDSAK